MSETKHEEVALEDVKLEEEEETPLPTSVVDLGFEIPPEIMEMFGASFEPINLRKAQPFLDVEFKALHTHTELEGTEAEGFESFLGSEFETKLNEAVERKLNLKFLYRCPNKEKCTEDWHQYCLTYLGDEYIDWFIAIKMGTRNGVWVDDRKVSENGGIGHAQAGD